MWQQLLPGLRMTLVMTVLTGLNYPLAVTGLSQVLFRDKANGSLITLNGHVIGSELIGQNFTKPEYFHPRPSNAGDNGYDAANSSGSNLGPTSQKLADALRGRALAYRSENGLPSGKPIPADAITSSGSGLDPHISVANALLQTSRVASARKISVEEVKK